MSNKKVFLKDISVVSFGNILSRVLSATISIILARLLGPTDFGKFSIIFAIMTTIGTGFSGIDITFVYNSLHPSNFKKFTYGNYIYSKLVISLIIIIPLILLAPIISKYAFHGISNFGIIVALISSLSFVGYTTVYTYYQRKEIFIKYFNAFGIIYVKGFAFSIGFIIFFICYKRNSLNCGQNNK